MVVQQVFDFIFFIINLIITLPLFILFGPIF